MIYDTSDIKTLHVAEGYSEEATKLLFLAVDAEAHFTEEESCDLINQAMSEGADINARIDSVYQPTPLMWAITSSRNPSIVKLLLDKEANPNLLDTRGFNAFDRVREVEILAKKNNSSSYSEEEKRNIQAIKQIIQSKSCLQMMDKPELHISHARMFFHDYKDELPSGDLDLTVSGIIDEVEEYTQPQIYDTEKSSDSYIQSAIEKVKLIEEERGFEDFRRSNNGISWQLQLAYFAYKAYEEEKKWYSENTVEPPLGIYEKQYITHLDMTNNEVLSNSVNHGKHNIKSPFADDDKIVLPLSYGGDYSISTIMCRRLPDDVIHILDKRRNDGPYSDYPSVTSYVKCCEKYRDKFQDGEVDHIFGKYDGAISYLQHWNQVIDKLNPGQNQGNKRIGIGGEGDLDLFIQFSALDDEKGCKFIAMLQDEKIIDTDISLSSALDILYETVKYRSEYTNELPKRNNRELNNLFGTVCALGKLSEIIMSSYKSPQMDTVDREIQFVQGMERSNNTAISTLTEMVKDAKKRNPIVNFFTSLAGQGVEELDYSIRLDKAHTQGYEMHCEHGSLMESRSLHSIRETRNRKEMLSTIDDKRNAYLRKLINLAKDTGVTLPDVILKQGQNKQDTQEVSPILKNQSEIAEAVTRSQGGMKL